MRFSMNIFVVILFLTQLPIGQAEGLVRMTPASKTPDAIVRYVEAAVALIQENGKEEAFCELTDPGGPWVDGDWYLYVCNMDGHVVAHLNKKLVGRDMMGMRDVKGIPFFAQFQKIALSENGRGWQEFWWPKPGATEASRKIGFIIRVPGEPLWVGTGVYDMNIEDLERILQR